MYKRQHYAIEHSEGNSASSGSSSSLDTASDADSGGGAEELDDAAWPASSHDSDESSAEEDAAEVSSSTSVAARRAEAIRIAERKLAEAAEDAGEYVVDSGKSDEGSQALDKSGIDDIEVSNVLLGDEHGPHHPHTTDGDLAEPEIEDEGSDVEASEELLAQSKVSSQWAEVVDEDEAERILDKFEGKHVICVGDENKVFRCRLCTKVICLNEETMQAHLASKRHARSIKQLAEGRLKVQLDSDGEEEEDGETHAERYARTVAALHDQKEASNKRKRDSGRQRQRKRKDAKNKDPGRGEKIIPVVPGKNRKERRALLHGTSSDGKDGVVSVPEKQPKKNGMNLSSNGSKVKGNFKPHKQPRHKNVD